MNEIKKIRISPSVNLTVIPSEKFKISYLSVYFSRTLDKNEAAFNALIPEILTRSCQKYPTMLELSSRLQSLYGASVDPVNTVMGETQVFGLYSSFPENKYAFDGTDILSEITDLISEIVNHPLTDADGAFDQTVVESEKSKLCDRIRARINNPASYAVRRCEEIMCANERYSISPQGTLESVCAVDAKKLYSYYRALPGNTSVDVFYSGSADEKTLAERIKEIFKDFNIPLSPRPSTQIKRRTEGEVKTVIEEQPIAQGKLTIGMRSGYTLSDEDYHVFSLMNALLGASPTSKLFMNVREKMSLCYYCSSRPNALKGIVTVASGIEVDNFEKAKNAIFAQIEALKSGDISDFELESAKKSLVNSYKELTDSPAGLVSWYLARSFAGRSDSPSENAERIMSLTKQDVISAANKLSPDTVYFLKGTLLSDPGEDTENEDESI